MELDEVKLDELKQAWAGMERRQDGMAAWLQADRRARGQDKMHATLRWSLAGRLVELAIWITFTVCVATFWVDHRQVTHWLVIGLMLHVYGIAGIWASATQWLLLTRIQLFDAPVVVLQKRLAQLRQFRVWCSLGLGLPWWCLWLLLPMVGAEWLAGVDVYVTEPLWFWACMATGIIGMVASVCWARHLAGRPIKSRWLQRMVDDMSGCNLRRAARQLDELARFARD
ncbi:MAG TPA: hypothetical protein VF269_08345 [Rhodanobacteraceae bacterium]